LKYIQSKNNIKFKSIKKLLTKPKSRKNANEFILEGVNEILLCFEAKYDFKELFICSEIISQKNLINLNKNLAKIEKIDLSKNLYNQISYKKKGEGVLALVKSKEFKLNDLILPKNPFILVIESPEKPGNIGALLRTADAAGMDAVVIANPKTEIYNPNIINSSLGSIFTLQIGVGSTKEVIDFLLKNKIKIYSTFVKDSVDYLKVKYSKACAVVIGTESTSLTNVWKSQTTELIKIPMKGKMDSLNLSVSAAIVIFEVLKQRNAI
jgi:TrmH family RNA methyltransferase